MVFNVPAETLGALSILNDMYSDIKYEQNGKDQWFFVLSKPSLDETVNIKVLNFPWIKKSWFHRLYFDYFIAPGLIKRYKVDRVISYQNTIIPRVKVYQTLYFHNSIPFTDIKFRLLEDVKLWTYQNIISKLIFKSLIKANQIIVQSNWIKDACVSKLGIDERNILVQPPEIRIDNIQNFDELDKSYSTFFYPAGAFKYKNHQVIVDACKLLEKKELDDIKIIFTLTGEENDYSRFLKGQVNANDLPIQFIGEISREKVFGLYSQSVLLFPSYLETFGLPILEARMHKCPIICSNMYFSKEILDQYTRVKYFNVTDSKNLSEIILDISKSNKIGNFDGEK